MRELPAADENLRYGRSAAGLTVVLGLAGALTYIFFAVASRALPGVAYGEIVVLWSAAFLLGSTLYRPVEQLLARSLAAAEGGDSESVGALRAAALIQLALVAAAVVALILLRAPVQEQLFSSDPGLFWALPATLAGFGLAFWIRGCLAGRRRFRLYAAVLLAEALLRLAFVLAVAIGIAGGSATVAIGIALAPFVGLLALPAAVRGASGERERAPASPPGGGLTIGRGSAFAGAVLLMMLSEQILVTSGALIVRAAEGAIAAGLIFNVMMIVRAPLVLFQAVAASLLPHLSRLQAGGGAEGREAFEAALAGTVKLIAALALLATAAVAAVGPQAMELAFGDSFTYVRLDLTIVAAGMGMYLIAASLTQAALAQGQASAAAGAWVLCAAAFLAFNLLAPIDPVRAVEIGFAGAAALLMTLLGSLHARARRRPPDALGPGSPEQIQARLAAADEIG